MFRYAKLESGKVVLYDRKNLSMACQGRHHSMLHQAGVDTKVLNKPAITQTLNYVTDRD